MNENRLSLRKLLIEEIEPLTMFLMNMAPDMSNHIPENGDYLSVLLQAIVEIVAVRPDSLSDDQMAMLRHIYERVWEALPGDKACIACGTEMPDINHTTCKQCRANVCYAVLALMVNGKQFASMAFTSDNQHELIEAFDNNIYQIFHMVMRDTTEGDWVITLPEIFHVMMSLGMHTMADWDSFERNVQWDKWDDLFVGMSFGMSKTEGEQWLSHVLPSHRVVNPFMGEPLFIRG